MDGNGSQLNGGQRDDLAGRISRYGTAIATLQQNPTATTILAALLARDSVEDALQGLEPPAVSETAEQLMALLALDQQLKQQATVIYATVDLAAWQKSFHPPETAWWWYLSEPVHRLDRHDWLWNTLTVIALTASGSLLVDISGKFLTGGPGLLGSFTVLSQSVMTVATAGGVLTQQGRRIIEQAIASLGIKRPLWQETKLGLSLLLLAVLMGFRSSLPQIAAALTNRGEVAQESGDYSEAETAYKRAIALDKDNVQARYKLGVVYDDLARPEAAEEQFLFAVNDGYLPANNDLALLYLENDEPDKAAALLTQALEQIEDSPDTAALRADLWINLGWARFQQGRLAEAQESLQRGLALGSDELQATPDLSSELEMLPGPEATGDEQPDGEPLLSATEAPTLSGKPYCLLAQIGEQTGDVALAETAAAQCIGLANRRNPQEDAWAYEALQQLQGEAVEDGRSDEAE
jgi:tetratricopeptide (TPR) repeat protein